METCKIGKKNKENEVVTIYAGNINATGKTLWWKNEKYDVENIELQDYAIVENMSNYDLVTIVGILRINKKDVNKITNTSYINMKNIFANFAASL